MSPKNTTRKKKSRKGIRIGILMLVFFAFISATFFYLLFLKSATTFEEDEYAFYIPTSKATPSLVKSRIKSIVKPSDYTTFLSLALSTGYWNNIKPGKYLFSKGSGIFTIFRKLKGGRQTPVTLTLNKYRTQKDLAEYLSGRLEFTTASVLQYMNNSDSLKSLGIKRETMMTIIIPNTYEIYWNTTPGSFFNRMKKESEKFWDDDRLSKAESIGLTPVEVYTLASIVEEETNDHKEKPLIASVYLNRLKKGMPLGADPTVKFAYGDFSIRRVTLNHINKSAASPYNTYKNKGIPPGPICTPSQKSIDAVLNAEKTTYIFFCAKADFSGSHSFASTEEEHFENARKYRKALDSLKIH
jgi:UPF0755 protein